MTRKVIQKVFLWCFSIAMLLTAILAIHIYIVTRPKAPDAYTRVMARIDIKQDITANDAAGITSWLYQQKGVDHVLVNPETHIVIFTFSPIQASADQLVSSFKSHFPYQGDRFVPSASDLKDSCPVASTSRTYKIYSFLANLF